MGSVECELECLRFTSFPVYGDLTGCLLDLQGLLLIGILSGFKSTDAFGKDMGVTKVKAYLVFILAFTAITNLVVSMNLTRLYLLASRLIEIAAIYWVNAVSASTVDHWMIDIS
jgi:hypothetical protein